GQPRLDAGDDAGSLELGGQGEEVRIVVRWVLAVFADLREQLLVPAPDRREVVQRQRAQRAIGAGQRLDGIREEVAEIGAVGVRVRRDRLQQALGELL